MYLIYLGKNSPGVRGQMSKKTPCFHYDYTFVPFGFSAFHWQCNRVSHMAVCLVHRVHRGPRRRGLCPVPPPGQRPREWLMSRTTKSPAGGLVLGLHLACCLGPATLLAGTSGGHCRTPTCPLSLSTLCRRHLSSAIDTTIIFSFHTRRERLLFSVNSCHCQAVTHLSP